MKIIIAITLLTVAGASAQDFSSIVSSALSVASSYVAEHNMNEIVSSGLAEASSWAANNDINSIMASIGSDIGITDSNGISEAYSRATEYLDSLTDAANILDVITAANGAAITSTTQAQAASSTDDDVSTNNSSEPSTADSNLPVASLSSVDAAGNWAVPTGAGFGGLFLGLIAAL